MKKILLNSVLVAGSALIALALYVGLYSPPAGMIPESNVADTDDGSSTMVDLDALQIVGVSSALDFSDTASAGDEIALLWDNFDSNSELQAAIDWSQSYTVYAIYSSTEQHQYTMLLTIGVTPTALRQQIKREPVSVPGGLYQDFPVIGVDDESVDAVWQQIFSIYKFPRVVIERYALDSLGQVQQIQMQALFN